MNRLYLVLSAAALFAACGKEGGENFNVEAAGGRDLASLNVSNAKMIYQKTVSTKAAGESAYWKVDLSGNESMLEIKGKEGETYDDIDIVTVSKLSERVLLVQVDSDNIHVYPDGGRPFYLVDVPTEKMYQLPEEMLDDLLHGGTLTSASDEQGNVYFASGYDRQYREVYKIDITDFTIRPMLPDGISFNGFMVTGDGFIAYWSGYDSRSDCRIKCPGGRIYPLSDVSTFIFNGALYAARGKTIIRYETVGDNEIQEKEICTIPGEGGYYGHFVSNPVRKTVVVNARIEFDGKECKELERQVTIGDIRTGKAWYVIQDNTFLKTDMQDYEESQFRVSDYEMQTLSAGDDSPNIFFTGFRYSDGANVAGIITESDEVVIESVAENGNKIINLIALN